MTGCDGSPAEMPIVPFPADWPFPDVATAELLLSGEGAGPDAPPEQQALALVLSAAARPASQRELAGEEAAVAAYMRAVASGPRAGRWTRRGARPRVRTVPLVSKVQVLAAGAVIVVAAALSGTAAAGDLPTPLQKVAHTVFGAPAPGPAAPLPTQLRPSPLTVTVSATTPSAGPTQSAVPVNTAKTKAAGNREGSGQGGQARDEGRRARNEGNGNGNAQGGSNGNGGRSGSEHVRANWNGHGNVDGNGTGRMHDAASGTAKGRQKN